MNFFITAPLLLLADFSFFLAQAFYAMRCLFRRRGLFLRQCEAIGVQSFWIMLFSGIFLGAVLSYQLYSALIVFHSEAMLGSMVGVSLFRELAPVIGSILVTGRAGSAIAAELASMSVSEQLDALEVLAVDAMEYLVAPRILAGILMMPILIFLLAWTGSFTAYLLSSKILGLDGAIYWHRYWRTLTFVDWTHCFTKSVVFGWVFASIACFCGLRARGGAQSVGKAAQETVVASFLAILFLDYFLTAFLPFGLKTLLMTP